MNADEIIARYALAPPPRRRPLPRGIPRFRPSGGRGAVTSIYYLLRAGEVSHWHRIDAGGNLALPRRRRTQARSLARRRVLDQSSLGVNDGAWPQVTVPVGAWQSARSEGDWSLVGCTVAPAFEFAGFELAPPGWQPGQS